MEIIVIFLYILLGILALAIHNKLLFRKPSDKNFKLTGESVDEASFVTGYIVLWPIGLSVSFIVFLIRLVI